ncbi:MAG: hypothetical protein VKM34_06180 [Cyanobacteriota bacterium]|nr:hypothetical protein [Cyanobacteriota bacterium]
MNFSVLLKWVASFWCQISSRFTSRSDDDNSDDFFSPDAIREIQQMIHQFTEGERHLEAARAGVGPQPWDQDWHEFQLDLSTDLISLAHKAGWHRVQNFLEIIVWALSSPQGQEALLLSQHPDNSWQGPLKLIGELYPPLRHASHEMLRKQARGLNYSKEWIEQLESAITVIKNSPFRRS